INGTYIEEPEIERLIEMRTLIDRLKIRVNLLGHHISNTLPFTGALPDDKITILSELDRAIAHFSEEDLQSYRSSIRHL
ncbi:MAG: radical SAM protein, partial [Muribaculaceae bacterium]|nr:radical SAM protein [Muribaculaceae bacterium]